MMFNLKVAYVLLICYVAFICVLGPLLDWLNNILPEPWGSKKNAKP